MLTQAISSYQSATKLLTSHYFLSDEEIEAFKQHCNDFFESWIEVFGVEGVTN
jgi:hypothetical protein